MKARWISGALLILLISMQFAFPLVCRAEGEDDPLWNKPSYDKKIIQVGQRILAANGIKERITFFYVSKDVRNADARRWFSPNTIRVFKDITDIVSSDDELAAVLSHEIAHIVNRHTRKAILTKTPIILGTTALAGAATIATGGLAAPIAIGLGGKAIIRPVDRGLVTNADMAGLDLMVKAGYNPLAMETFMTKLTGDAGLMTSFFSTHPLGTKRIAHIHEAIKQKYPQFLTDELANNPVPGSPYQLQPKEKKKKKATQLVNEQNKPAVNATDSTAEKPNDKALEEKQALYNRLDQLAHPEKTTVSDNPTKPEKQQQTTSPNTESEPIAAVGVEEKPSPAEAKTSESVQESPLEASEQKSVNSSPLKPAPQKISYAPAQSALKKTPVKQNYAIKTTTEKPMVASVEQSTHKTSDISIALVLLELSSDQQKALKLITQRHYMSREDLKEYFPGWEPDLLNSVVVNGLIQKKLIRIVGGDNTDYGYVLTDSASAVLEKSKTE